MIKSKLNYQDNFQNKFQNNLQYDSQNQEIHQNTNQYHHGHDCIHDQLHIPEAGLIEDFGEDEFEQEVVQNKQQYRRNLNIRNPQTIRITYDEARLQPQNMPKGYEKYAEILQQQMNIAIKFFDDFLKINRLTKRNKYAKQIYNLYNHQCQGVEIPEEHVKKGVQDSDLHIYVDYEINDSSSYLANAGACFFYTGKRPTFGRIKFNLYRYDIYGNTTSDFAKQLETVIHEMTHVLGFSSFLYKNFINPSTGEAYSKGSEKPIFVQNIRGIETSLIKTQNVVKVAKEIFGCNELEGVQLENNGGDGTAGSHWEKTILFDDYMNPQALTQQAKFSKLSLALLEDSGWYSVDYTNAETSLWGYKKGCEFLNSNNYNQFREFQKPEVKDVTFDYTGCGIGSYSQYTQNGGRGYTAYFIQYFNNRYCADKNYQVDSLVNLPYGYYFGSGGRCAKSNLVQQGFNLDYSYQCHQFTCDQQNNIYIIVNGEQYPCQIGGMCQVYIKGQNQELEGSIYTPEDVETFCQTQDLCPDNCSNNGYCLNGQCKCLVGTGPDCKIVEANDDNGNIEDNDYSSEELDQNNNYKYEEKNRSEKNNNIEDEDEDPGVQNQNVKNNQQNQSEGEEYTYDDIFEGEGEGEGQGEELIYDIIFEGEGEGEVKGKGKGEEYDHIYFSEGEENYQLTNKGKQVEQRYYLQILKGKLRIHPLR